VHCEFAIIGHKFFVLFATSARDRLFKNHSVVVVVVVVVHVMHILKSYDNII
jgi:hypothetical protein